MNRSLWISKTGMDAQQLQMDVISNNLANVGTNGFKASRAVFEDLIYQTLRAPGAPSSTQTNLPSGLQVGTGVMPVATEHILTQGNLTQTSNPTDVAIQGSGFFQVQLPDGTTGYTRDGAFQTNAQGQLVSSNGYVLQPPVTLPANALTVTIANDGTVSVTQPGTASSVQVGALQLAMFPNPGGLDAKGGNIFSETTASGAATTTAPGQNGAGTLQAGYVETSNVNVVEELVNMIQTQRSYEINSKSISTTDQMLAKLSQM